MRILFILPCLPFPPEDGGRAKVFNVLRFMSERHVCSLICFGRASPGLLDGIRKALPHLGSIYMIPPPGGGALKLTALGNMLCLRPPSFARFASAQLRERLAAFVNGNACDVIHYDIINMAQYLDCAPGIASLHSPNDATSNVYFRMAAAAHGWWPRLKLVVSAMLLRRFEQREYRNFSLVHVVSGADEHYLKGLDASIATAVVPISSGYSCSIVRQGCTLGVATTLSVAVCGNLGNAAIAAGFIAFLDDVFPRILEAFPGVRLRVLGRDVEKGLLRRIGAMSNVEYFPWVEDFDAFISAADIVLVPDAAGAPGAKTRVVQAMALGRPVLGSTTAFEGVPAEHGTHGLIYAGSTACLSALKRLLSDPGLRVRMGHAAAVLAAEEYSIERVGPRYEALYRAAFDKHAARGRGMGKICRRMTDACTLDEQRE